MFIPCVGCKTPSPGKMYGHSKVCFNERASVEFVFITNPYVRTIFHHLFNFPDLFIHIFTFPDPKIIFPPSIKSFQSLQGVWKHLLGSLYFSTHFLPFIVHPPSKSKEIPKKSLHFNLITFLLVDSTSTRHFSKLKIRFEELSIIFLKCKFVHSTTVFLSISQSEKSQWGGELT